MNRKVKGHVGAITCLLGYYGLFLFMDSLTFEQSMRIVGIGIAVTGYVILYWIWSAR